MVWLVEKSNVILNPESIASRKKKKKKKKKNESVYGWGAVILLLNNDSVLASAMAAGKLFHSGIVRTTVLFQRVEAVASPKTL